MTHRVVNARDIVSSVLKCKSRPDPHQLDFFREVSGTHRPRLLKAKPRICFNRLKFLSLLSNQNLYITVLEVKKRKGYV